TVYIDYNVIVNIAGTPAKPSAGQLRVEIDRLLETNHRIALSAWHAYELARSNRPEHVNSCCSFVEEINPVWLSNPQFIKSEEIARFLSHERRPEEIIMPVSAMNNVYSQMWATYGGPVLIGETFRFSIEALQNTPGALEHINRAALETPRAIQIGREAYADGRLAANQHVIDREYFEGLIGRRGDDVDFVMNNMGRAIAF